MRFLHFGTEWVQGAMRLKKPNHIELEYAQQMMAWLLFIETPKRIVQLGLGSAALTKFAHAFLKRAKVEAVELNPSVVIAARTMFELPNDDARLTVHEQDAWDFVNDRANHGTIGALQIDVYDATARGPVLDSVGVLSCVPGLPDGAGGRGDGQPVRRSSELRAQHEAPERSLRWPRDRAARSPRRQSHCDRVCRARNSTCRTRSLKSARS